MPSPAQNEALPRPAVKFATTLLKRQHRRVVKRSERFAALSAAERHQLRIHIKELRYAAEFFASLFPGSTRLDYAKAASKLQDCLGALKGEDVSAGVVVKLPGQRVVNLSSADHKTDTRSPYFP